MEETLRSISFALVRLASFSAHALLFGLVVILVWVVRPSFERVAAAEWTRGRRLVSERLEGFVRAAIVVSIVATSLGLLLQVLLVAEFQGGEIARADLASVIETTFGRWYLVRLPLLGAALVLLVGRVRQLALAGAGDGEPAPRAAWWAAWGAIALGLLSTSTFSGHAAVASPQLVALVTDVVHLAAGAIWFTGIVALAVILPDAWVGQSDESRLEMLAPAIVSFSRVALVSIAVVGITGVVNSWVNVGALDDLVDTGYGRAVSAKLVLFVAILGVGAVNHFWVRSRLQQGGDSPHAARRVLRKTLAVELTLAISVMSVTGVLVGLARTKEGTVQSLRSAPGP